MVNPIKNPHNSIDFIVKSETLQLADSITSVNHEIEMLTYQSTNYTSLKDLMSTSSPSTPLAASYHWKEIPIKDPLLQHAAWAYLQPMAPREDVRWWKKLGDNCCRIFGCLDGVASVVFRGWSPVEESGDHVDRKVD